MERLWRRRPVAGSLLRRVPGKHLVLNVRIGSQRLAKPRVRRVICFRAGRVFSCEHRKCKKMVFLAAIREKSLRRVALPWDAHVMSASSGEIRQPFTESLGESAYARTFFNRTAFLRGKLLPTPRYGTHQNSSNYEGGNRRHRHR